MISAKTNLAMKAILGLFNVAYFGQKTYDLMDPSVFIIGQFHAKSIHGGYRIGYYETVETRQKFTKILEETSMNRY